MGACAQGNAVPRQQCPVQGADLLQRLAGVQLENINLKKAAGEEVTAESLGLPRTTDDCGWDTGLACAGDIGSAVLDCAGIFVNPLELDMTAGLVFAGSSSGCSEMDIAETCKESTHSTNTSVNIWEPKELNVK